MHFIFVIAKVLLLLDDSHDLAENFVSPWSVLRRSYSRNQEIRLRAVETIAAYKDWNGKT